MKIFSKLLNYFVSDKTIQLTKLEILNETVEYYSADTSRRGLDSRGDCKYNGENGTHCAVGRCLLPKLKKRGNRLLANNSTIGDLISKNKGKTIDDVLEKQYRGHDIYFWRSLQGLHDSDTFWDKSGITPNGERKVEEIIQNHNLN